MRRKVLVVTAGGLMDVLSAKLKAVEIIFVVRNPLMP